MTNVRDIHSMFIHHRETAEGTYRREILTVDAYALSAGESMYSTPVVEASDAPDGEALAIFVLPFGKHARASFARLKTVQPGQRIWVSGECRMFSDDGNVLVFKDCRLVAPQFLCLKMVSEPDRAGLERAVRPRGGSRPSRCVDRYSSSMSVNDMELPSR